jgi:hypothetical protein
MVQIRTAAEQLAAEQQQRVEAAEHVTSVVGELDQKLEEFSKMAAEARNGSVNGGPRPETS